MITVYIPTYNFNERYINDACASVFLQKCLFNINIVLLYGGGNMGITELENITKLYNNIQVIDNSVMQGIAHNWNYALKNCETKYFTILHQDDVLEPTYISEMVATLENHSDWSLIYCDNYTIDKEGNRHTHFVDIVKKLNRGKEISIESLKPLLKFPIITCPTVMYRTKDAKKIGLFSEVYKNELDWEYWLRTVFMGYKIGYLNKRLYSYRRHGENESKKNEINLIKYNECQKLFEEYYEKYSDIYQKNGINKHNLMRPVFMMGLKDLMSSLLKTKHFNTHLFKFITNLKGN